MTIDILDEHIELNICNYDHDDVAQLNSWAIQACEEIERLRFHIRRWSPVEADPPPTKKTVLIAVCGVDWPVAAMLASDRIQWVEPTGETHDPRYVTHWLPLPSLPESQTDGK
jgi:hypothetical protein